MTDEPLAHILRTRLPWRDDVYTECGRHENDVKSTITRNEVKARVNKWGRQRTAFTVCMTCLERAKYADTWETNPVAVLRRECERVGWGWTTPIHPDHPYARKAQRLTDELHAIAALINEHRSEFDEYLTAKAAVSSLDDYRKPKHQRANRTPPPPRPTRPDSDPQPL